MRFSTGSRRSVVDDDIACRQQERPRRDGISRIVALQPKSPAFYGQALGLAVIVVLAVAMLGVAHGAERLAALKVWSWTEQISERDGFHARGAVAREVSDANTF